MAKNDNAKGGKGAAGKGGAKGGGKPAAKPSGKGAPQGGGKAAKGGEKRGPLQPKGHAGAGLPVAAPRLKQFYDTQVRARLAQQFGLENPHQIPTLEKVVVNCGVGEAIKQPRVLDTVVDELALITGQRPVRRKAKKSIANFGLREGQEIGAMVTLRGARMWEFLDRFIAVALPRVRDFRGLSTRSFDGRGNYSLGVKEQMIFPEINYDMVEQVHGMDITIVTTAERDDLALALLRELGMPFRGEQKPVVPRPDRLDGQLTEAGAAA
ncbi:Ribosomal protein L5 [Gemmatirosa kalamazoonensis]|uniref:Large ribosomal subunit protein uL5 n=1 Tax=Gemmatirosa kalamazoonensis TaxID=861299 RepID=W0RLL6_9BACT|nr:Ribosomal protein L5 [Gemmatirosa kalamazoonensis]